MKFKSYLQYCFSLLIVLLLFNTSLSQKPSINLQLEILPDETETSIIQNNMRINELTGVPFALYTPDYPVAADTPEKMARQFLKENHNLFKLSEDLSELRYFTTKETPGGYHVHFNQYIGEYPVWNSRINVTISQNNRVVFVANGSKIQYGVKVESNLEKINFTKEQAMESAKNYLGINSSIVFEKSETAIYYNKGTFRLAQVVTIVPAEELFGDWEVMIDAQTGEIFRVEDKACYFQLPVDNLLMVNGTGYVFDPDPITHARTTYGSPGFSDNNDADSDSLTAHRELRTLYDITFEGGSYVLKGPWAEIRDFESPYTGLHTNPTSDFLFTRSHDTFEAVNVYFHIDNSMRWVNNTLGFAVHPFQYVGGVRFDPHGLGGDDNSHYIPSTGSIAYGDGGVDDAEDLGVVLHELGHGIHDWITNGGLSQVQGLSEGSCDYWATSYVRSTGYWTPAYPAYNWVFIWDGHNPFWAGRITNYTAHYPEGLVGQIHTDGQMWSSSLMSIYDLIGKIPTDTDFLEALSMTNSSSNQQDAANAFIAADQLLYSGSHLAQIIPVFVDRGYITGPITVDFTADVTNGPAPLTVHFTDLSISQPNPIISWEWDFQNDGIVDATVQNPTWTYTGIGLYSVKLSVSDGTNNASKVKSNYINVLDPNIVSLFCDDLTTLANWTITNDGGVCIWESRAATGRYTMPPTAVGNCMAADADNCNGNTGNVRTTARHNGINASIYQNVWLEFDNDWRHLGASDEAHVEVSTNGGSSWIGVWDKVGLSVRNTHEIVNITSHVALKTFDIRFRTIQPGWDWWWAVDNICIYATEPIPVELASFTASSAGDEVELNWTTATETNNQGFSIERVTAGGAYQEVGYVAGFGTTTEPKSYSFVDSKLESGNYTYRLKQVDYDGTFTYSDEVNVDVEIPLVYSLEQNYPNPFNPSTIIKYSIAEEGFVKLAVYNMLGEEVATIVNASQKAGRYEVNFNATGLSSGVYVYRLETANFVTSKKLMLMK